jgi:TrmH family RNA methyltransferase
MLSKNQIKFIKSLSLKKNRMHHQLFTVEGSKGILEFLDSDLDCEFIYTTNPELFEDHSPVLISPNDLKRISQLKTPNQSVALFKMPAPAPVDQNRLILGLDDIKDPGNLGTMIRLADWFGLRDIICSVETVDCYNAKVVQASMGSLSRVRLHYMDLKEFFGRYSGEVYATVLDGNSIYQSHFQEKAVLLMGNESNGISEDLLSLIKHRITIPQYGRYQSTESLNVATAAAICLAEISRTIGRPDL